MITDFNGCVTNKSRTIISLLPPIAFFPLADDITVECGEAMSSSLSYTNNASRACLISGSVNSTLSSQTLSNIFVGTITET